MQYFINFMVRMFIFQEDTFDTNVGKYQDIIEGLKLDNEIINNNKLVLKGKLEVLFLFLDNLYRVNEENHATIIDFLETNNTL